MPPPALLALHRAVALAHEPAAALAELRAATTAAPESAPLWFLLARALREEHGRDAEPKIVREIADALTRARAALTHAPSPLDADLALLGADLVRPWEGPWELDREEAYLHRDIGRWPEALAAAERYAAARPDDPEPRFLAGQTLTALHRDDEACAAYGAAIALSADSPADFGVAAALGRARIDARRARVADALADVTYALAHDPSCARFVEQSPDFAAVRAHADTAALLGRARTEARAGRLAAQRESTAGDFDLWDATGAAAPLRAVVLAALDAVSREVPAVERAQTDREALLGAVEAVGAWVRLHPDEADGGVVRSCVVPALRRTAGIVGATEALAALDGEPWGRD